jgi:hypothetical protein
MTSRMSARMWGNDGVAEGRQVIEGREEKCRADQGRRRVGEGKRGKTRAVGDALALKFCAFN